VNGPILASSLRNDVTNAVLLLSQRPLFWGQNNTGASAGSGGSDFSLAMTAELVDTWNGHDDVTSSGGRSSQYFCQLPGWYLCKIAVPWGYTGTTQYLFGAGFQWTTSGVLTSTVRGANQLCGSTHNPVPQAVDLIEQVNAAPPGGGGDYIQFTSVQTSGSGINLTNTGTELPNATVRWVAATTGTTGLPVPVNASWPVPTAYITPAFLNTNIRDTIRFLCYPPICKATSASGSLPSQSFPSGTVVPLTTVVVDNYGGFTTGSGANYQAPVSGVYYVYGQFNLSASTGSTAYCAGLSVNGASAQWGDSVNKISDTTGGGAMVGKHLRLNSGDTVQFVACQGSGSSISYNGSGINQCRMIVVWESG
jgi:hypothetical protein